MPTATQIDDIEYGGHCSPRDSNVFDPYNHVFNVGRVGTAQQKTISTANQIESIIRSGKIAKKSVQYPPNSFHSFWR